MNDRDIGDAEFEDRIRALLGGGDARALSAGDVIERAKRRRKRRRATAAGSTATLAVVGVAAGVVVLGGGSRGTTGVEGTKPAVTTPRPTVPTTPTTALTTTTPPPEPKTCSASVTGTVPQPDTSTDEQGLRWDTFSGTAAGSPWSIQVHVFPDATSYGKFANKVPGSVPTQALTSLHPGADAVFRTPGETGWSMHGMPDSNSSPQEFFGGSASGLGGGPPTGKDKVYPAYLTEGWVATDVDHMCLQYADRAEFVPVVKVQGGTFTFFGVVTGDKPKTLFAYDAHGREIGREKAVQPMPGAFFFVP
ncbi:hypothetical protein [Catenulispora subtropica]|uniref:Uncharacterized protein n=1 Tax=Catenulispora subtropica TaxID=450798 RepID=A0ABN2S161_9ACTN